MGLVTVDKIKYWCAKILPLVYDDSLSYYEVLAKTTAKLNEVIDSVNAQNEVIAGYNTVIESFKNETNQRYEDFTQAINGIIEEFEGSVNGTIEEFTESVNGALDDMRDDIADYKAEMQEQYDNFLEHYLQTLGVVQTTGTSTTEVMSQKAVTDELNFIKEDYNDKIDEANDNIEDNTNDINELKNVTKQNSVGISTIWEVLKGSDFDVTNEKYDNLRNDIIGDTVEKDDVDYNCVNRAGTMFAKASGKSVKFNQLVRNGNFVGTSGWVEQNTSLSTSNNILTMTVTNSANSCGVRQQGILKGIVGHKYYFSCKVKCSINTTNTRIAWDNLRTIVSEALVANNETVLSGLITVTNGGTQTMYIYIDNVQQDFAPIGTTMELSNVQLLDLTVMGLDSIETVDEFITLYPKSYYANNAGTIYNSKISGLALTGKNLWDEQWEVGNIGSTGGMGAEQNCIRSKNYIPCKPSTSYYFKIGNYVGQYYGAICFYDLEKNFLLRAWTSNLTFSTPSNAYFLKFTTNSGGSVYGGTYNNDICINVSDASFNGSYLPYVLRNIDLGFSNELKGIGENKDYFTIEENTNNEYFTARGHSACGELNMKDDLSWFYDSVNQLFYADLTGKDTEQGNILCNKYTTYTGTIADIGNGQISSGGTNNKTIYVKDSNYNNVTDFVNSLADETLIFVLQTPSDFVMYDNLTAEQTIAICENLGMLSVIGNTNEDYVTPDVEITRVYKLVEV